MNAIPAHKDHIGLSPNRAIGWLHDMHNDLFEDARYAEQWYEFMGGEFLRLKYIYNQAVMDTGYANTYWRRAKTIHDKIYETYRNIQPYTESPDQMVIMAQEILDSLVPEKGDDEIDEEYLDEVKRYIEMFADGNSRAHDVIFMVTNGANKTLGEANKYMNLLYHHITSDSIARSELDRPLPGLDKESE